MEKTVNNSQVEVYNNYRELLMTVISAGCMILYLYAMQSDAYLSRWIAMSLLSAAAVFNCALFLAPKPKKEKEIPIWPYIKSYIFSCFLWAAVVICVAWKYIISTTLEGVCLTVLCFIFAGLMLFVGGFFLWSSYFFRQVHIKLTDEKMWQDVTDKVQQQNTLIARNHSYTQPCYVYADGFESETLQEERGMVVGYRIGPSLVIHCIIGDDGFTREDLSDFQQKFCGRLLENDDIKVLRQNWEAVSDMCSKTGNTPLPNTLFWYQNGNHTDATARKEELEGQTPEYCAIIMKI